MVEQQSPPANWVTIVFAIFFGGLFVLLLPVLMSDELRHLRFRGGGQDAKAVVVAIEKVDDFKRGDQTISTFLATYEYRADDGKSHRGTERFEVRAPSVMNRGDTIDVVYLKSMPTQSIVGRRPSGGRAIGSLLLLAGLFAFWCYLLAGVGWALAQIWRRLRTRTIAPTASTEPAIVEPQASRRGSWRFSPARLWLGLSHLSLTAFRETPFWNRIFVVTLFTALSILLVGGSIYLAKPMARSVQLMLFSERATGVILRTEVIERPASRSRARHFDIDTEYSFSPGVGQRLTGRALRTGFTRLRADEVGKPIEVYYLRGNPEVSGLYDDFQPEFSLLMFFGPMFAFLGLFFAAFWHGFWRFLRE